MYFVQPAERKAGSWALRERDAGDSSPAVDLFRSEAGARHAAQMLNGGLARIERHRPLGCRIQPVYAAARAVRAPIYAAASGERAA
jgi:hypothetical protein